MNMFYIDEKTNFYRRQYFRGNPCLSVEDINLQKLVKESFTYIESVE